MVKSARFTALMWWFVLKVQFIVQAASGEPLFDIDFSSLTHPPLWEPTLEEFFSAVGVYETNADGLASPKVLRSPTREEFNRHARRGYPILVEDWGKDFQMLKWDGAAFAEKFPFGYMKAEYITSLKGFKEKDHNIKKIDGELRFNLGTFKPDKKTMWHNFTRPASSKYKDDPQKPTSGPYVWHVKDELTGKQKKQVQKYFDAPSFMQDPLNREKMNESFEIWFSPGGGCGAGAHNDGYCQSVVSLQLVGDKKWRKMLEPEMTFLHSYDEFDGGVYTAGFWKPDVSFVNSAGSAVIWPPGYLHETKTFTHPEGKCGTAVTLQFSFPQPVQFLRAFLPRLSISAEVGHCIIQSWSGYVTFGLKLVPSSKEVKMKEQLKMILDKVDTNSDGSIALDEVIAFHKKPGAPRAQADAKHKELWIKFQSEDIVAYHDMNDDMIVSKQELWDSLVQWNVVRMRMQHGLEYLNVADRKGLEAFEQSLDYMRRKNVTFPKFMRPELKQLFALKKGTKVFPSMKKITSMSDGVFYNPLREQMQKIRRPQKSKGKGRKEL